MAEHVPSLAHIAAFVMKRGRRRAGVVRGHRRQVEAPREKRGFGYFYAPLITAAIRFVDSGLQGGAITDAVDASSHRQRRSYAAVAGGLESSLCRLSPAAAVRVNSSHGYCTSDGIELLLVRPHLRLTFPDGRATQLYVHFGEDEPTRETLAIILHALERCFPTDGSLVIDARRGDIYAPADVSIPSAVEELLLEELEQYAALWDEP